MAIGGNVINSTINVVCGVPPEKIEELVRSRTKDDTAVIAQSEWWSDLQRHFVVSFSKEYSIIILWFTCILIVPHGGGK